MTTKLSDIKDGFGSGGANLVPGQGILSIRDVFRDLLSRTYPPVADTTGLTNSLAADRVDGMTAVKLDDYTGWIWKAADTTAADSTHVAPTDVGAGAGRWVQKSETSGTAQGDIQHVSIDVPLATIIGKTSGAAFNVGAALPANAQVEDVYFNVLQVLAGGTISAATAKLQNTGETAGALLGGSAGTDVFTATGKFATPVGTDPYSTRGGQQLQLTLTATGDTLAHATTGHLTIEIFYSIVP